MQTLTRRKTKYSSSPEYQVFPVEGSDKSTAAIINARELFRAQKGGQLNLFYGGHASGSTSASDMAYSRLQELGPILPEDSVEVRKEKLKAAFALANAMAEEGSLELWSEDRIDLEIASMRGRA